MTIQNWSQDIAVVDLPAEPDLQEELGEVTEMLGEKGNRDVVLDFSTVDIVTSSSLSALLKLQKQLQQHNHRLIMAGCAPETRRIFKLTGIDELFEFVYDKLTALTGLQMVR